MKNKIFTVLLLSTICINPFVNTYSFSSSNAANSTIITRAKTDKEIEFEKYLETKIQISPNITIDKSIDSVDLIKKSNQYLTKCSNKSLIKNASNEETEEKESYERELFVSTTNPDIFEYTKAKHVLASTMKDDYFAYFKSEEDLFDAKKIIDKDPNTILTEQTFALETITNDYKNTDNELLSNSKDQSMQVNEVAYNSWGVKHMKLDKYADFLSENDIKLKTKVKVAVLDSGLDPTNELFNDKISYTDWIDVADPSHTTPIASSNHGVHVSGIIADATRTLSNIKIMPIKVSDDSDTFYSSNIYKGVIYAAENGASIGNVSLGARSPNTHTSYEKAMVENSYRTVFCVSSGNESNYTEPYSPAYSYDLMVVSNLKQDNIIAQSSNGSPYVSFCAPGTSIKSTVMGGGLGTMSGTSMASPHLAALCVMMKVQYPEYQVYDMKDRIKKFAIDLGPEGFDYRYGWGLPDAYNTAIHMKVTLNPDGGELEEREYDVIYGEKWPTIPDPKKEGYAFKAWKLEDRTYIRKNSIVKIARDMVATAIYEPIGCNLKFSYQDDNYSDTTITVPYGSKCPELPLPPDVDSEHVFVGWRSEDGMFIKEGDVVMLLKDITVFYPFIGQKDSIITFDSNDGEIETNTIKVSYNSFYPFMPIPSKYGYDFSHWELDDGTIIKEGEKVNIASDEIAHAVYTPKKINIRFDANGGYFCKKSDLLEEQNTCDNHQVTSDDTDDLIDYVDIKGDFNSFFYSLSLNNHERCEKCGFAYKPIRDGYSFKGWSQGADDKDIISQDYLIDSEDGSVVYAIWESSANNIYILYNKTSGEHLLTSSFNEYNKLGKIGWVKEGVAFENFTSHVDDSTPIYRVYNPKHPGGDHHYTKSLGEVKKLIKAGWRWDNKEKPVFYAKGSVNVYRLYNRKNGRHHYTKKKGEYDKLGKNGWVKEGVGWQAVK